MFEAISIVSSKKFSLTFNKMLIFIINPYNTIVTSIYVSCLEPHMYSLLKQKNLPHPEEIFEYSRDIL